MPMVARIFKFALVSALLIGLSGLFAYLSITWLIQSEDSVIVPNLEGKDVLYALEVLTDLGLNTKVRGYEYSQSVPKNHIISQEPQAGAERKKGRDVRVLISKGAETLIMPNLQNLSFQEAGIILEENGLCRGTVSRVYHAAVAEEHVIAQAPAPGTDTRKHECVHLLVSQGPPPIWQKMPDLVGLPLEEAVRALTLQRISVGAIDSVRAEGRPEHAVVDQDPLAGHRIMQGSTVHLKVNREPQAASDPVNGDPFPGQMLRCPAGPGFLNRHALLRWIFEETTVDLFDGYLSPGSELLLYVPDRKDADLLLLVDGEPVSSSFYPPGIPAGLLPPLPEMPHTDE